MRNQRNQPSGPPQEESPDSVCRCGHPQAAHEHYRRGSDCGVCGSDACPAFAAAQPTSVEHTADASAARTESNSA